MKMFTPYDRGPGCPANYVWLLLVLIFLVAPLAGLCVYAQEGKQERPSQEKKNFPQGHGQRGPGGPPPDGRGGPEHFPPPDSSFLFMSSEPRFGGKTVKAAPYSAVTETEAVQTLADGSRIVRKTTANVYRDS